MSGEITVAESLRFARKLKQMDSDGAQAIYVAGFARRVASRCAEIAEAEMEQSSNPGSSTAEAIRNQIRREFGLDSA